MITIYKLIKIIVTNIILMSLLCVGILTEFVSFNYLLVSHSNINIYVFIVAHIIGAILIALSMPYIGKPLYKNSQLDYFIFSFVMMAFIPVIGIIVLMVVFRTRKREANRCKDIVNTSLNRIKINEISQKQIKKYPKRVVSTNSIASILTSKNTLTEERHKAVLDTIKLSDKEAIPLLRKALKDEEDDVRLLAYALLKRKENIAISRLKNRLQEVNESNLFSLHKAIAYDCWEIIYLELMQGEVQKHYFDLAIKHIKISLSDNANDPGLNLLFAKILLKKRDLARSREIFMKAGSTGIDREKILPYFAELAFLEKRFCNMSIFIRDISKGASVYRISNLTEAMNER
jgi:hypothetical protein